MLISLLQVLFVAGSSLCYVGMLMLRLMGFSQGHWLASLGNLGVLSAMGLGLQIRNADVCLTHLPIFFEVLFLLYSSYGIILNDLLFGFVFILFMNNTGYVLVVNSCSPIQLILLQLEFIQHVLHLMDFLLQLILQFFLILRYRLPPQFTPLFLIYLLQEGKRLVQLLISLLVSHGPFLLLFQQLLIYNLVFFLRQNIIVVWVLSILVRPPIGLVILVWLAVIQVLIIIWLILIPIFILLLLLLHFLLILALGWRILLLPCRIDLHWSNRLSSLGLLFVLWDLQLGWRNSGLLADLILQFMLLRRVRRPTRRFLNCGCPELLLRLTLLLLDLLVIILLVGIFFLSHLLDYAGSHKGVLPHRWLCKLWGWLYLYHLQIFFALHIQHELRL